MIVVADTSVSLTIPEDVRRMPRLDAGEIAAIALAMEIAADAVLIDETDGRRAAHRLGLTTIGVAGILVRAHAAGLLSAVSPVLDQLQQKANFWLSVRPMPLSQCFRFLRGA